MNEPRRRLGVMGGTFDPIHIGHLVCAEEACNQFDLDEVLFMPAGQPWQKRAVTDAEDRHLMCLYATAPNERFSVSRLEIDRDGPTYTVDTMTALETLFEGSRDLFFITGADAVIEVLTWKDPEAVLRLATVIAATRPPHDLTRLEETGLASRIQIMEIPALVISSTDIRERVASRRSIRYLVPESVEDYIRQRRLYQQP